MTSRLDDRYLWLGFGIFFFLAAKGIKYAITDTVRLTKLEPISNQCDVPQDDEPEDNIAIDTLKKLASSPNPSIAASASVLIIKRFVSLPDALNIISQDLRSKDDATKRRATQAVHYLRDCEAEIYNDANIMDETAPHVSHEALVSAARTLLTIRQNDSDGRIRLPTREEMEISANVAGGLMTLDDLEREAERQDDVVSRLEELAEAAEFEWNSVRPGSAPYAGWDEIAVERANRDWVGGHADEAERRRRRRQAMVVGEQDHVGQGRSGWRVMR